MANGHEAEQVADKHMATASDTAIWNFAAQTAAVIITKDEDFAQRHALTGGGPAVIWIRLPNTRRKELLSWFEAILPECSQLYNAAKH